MNFPQADYMAMLRAKQQAYQNQSFPYMTPFPLMNFVPQPNMYSQPYMMPQFMQYPYMMMPQMQQQQQQQQQQMQQLQQFQQMQQMQQLQAQKPKPIPAPIQVEPTMDKSLPIHFNGTKIWLNLKLIRAIPTPSESEEAEDSMLDYDAQKKRQVKVKKFIAKIPYVQFHRTNRHIQRMISTRNRKVVEEPTYQAYQLFRKNDGYIRMGTSYQVQILTRPINLSTMRRKLKAFKMWDSGNKGKYQELQEMLGVDDQDLLKIMHGFTNLDHLLLKLRQNCPITTSEVQNLLNKK